MHSCSPVRDNCWVNDGTETSSCCACEPFLTCKTVDSCASRKIECMEVARELTIGTVFVAARTLQIPFSAAHSHLLHFRNMEPSLSHWFAFLSFDKLHAFGILFAHQAHTVRAQQHNRNTRHSHQTHAELMTALRLLGSVQAPNMLDKILFFFQSCWIKLVFEVLVSFS